MAKKRSTSRAKRAAGHHAKASSTSPKGTTPNGTTATSGVRAQADSAPGAAAKTVSADPRAPKPRSPNPRAASTVAAASASTSRKGGSSVTGASARKARVHSRQVRDRQRNALLAGAVAALVVGLVAYQVIRRSNLPGERFANQGNTHLTSIDSPHPPYNSDPPTSGWHMPGLASWGTHDRIVEDELLVHNLEDGGVVIYYPLGTPEENQRNIDAVRAIAAPYRNVVIAPREGLSNPYVFTAWQRLQRFDAIDEAAMSRFLEAYEGIDHHVAGIG